MPFLSIQNAASGRLPFVVDLGCSYNRRAEKQSGITHEKPFFQFGNTQAADDLGFLCDM